jgi:branched-chain amino acid transport system permease protein
VLQAFMPPEAFTFDTSGQLVIQTAIGGTGALFGPLLGAAIWLSLRDFLLGALDLGATWKLVLGVAFVLLVCFLQRGLIGAIEDLYNAIARRGKVKCGLGDAALPVGTSSAAAPQGPRIAIVNAPVAMAIPKHRRYSAGFEGPILTANHLTKRYGGLLANSDINFAVNRGELRGIIGPNGAGRTTFFKMLTCEVPPTSGTIMFEGRDITGMTVTDVCQLGLTKSYQVNQLFTRLTVRQNVTVAALATLRGKFRLDLFRQLAKIPGLNEQVQHTLELVDLALAQSSSMALRWSARKATK